MFYQNLTSWHKYNYSTEDKEGKAEEQNVRQCNSKEGIELLKKSGKEIINLYEIIIVAIIIEMEK